MFKFTGIVKEADLYVSKMKRKRFLRKPKKVLVISHKKDKHIQRMLALQKKKFKMSYFPGKPGKDGVDTLHHTVRFRGTAEEDKARIMKLIRQKALNKEAEDKASKKEQRKKD